LRIDRAGLGSDCVMNRGYLPAELLDFGQPTLHPHRGNLQGTGIFAPRYVGEREEFFLRFCLMPFSWSPSLIPK
jgi:hypothetical protein